MSKHSLPIIKYLNSLKAHIYNNWLLKSSDYSVVVIVSCLILASAFIYRPFSIIAIALLPLIILFKLTKKNVLVLLPIVFCVNYLLVIFSAVILDSLHVRINLNTLLLIVGIETVASMVIVRLRNKRFLVFNENIFSSHITVVLYIIFAIAMLSRVGSVVLDTIPILHDPAAHAFWAKTIVKDGSINYFYSPGIHVWIALLHEATNISIAAATNIVTNSLSALSVLIWGIALLILTRSKPIALLTGFFVLVAPSPMVLYFSAGKNALVAAIPFIALLLLSLKLYANRVNSRTRIFLFICLSSIGLLHYPAYAYGLGLCIIYMTLQLIGLIRGKIINTDGILKISKKAALLFAPIIISMFFIGLFIYSTSRENPTHTKVSSRENAKIFHTISQDTGIVDQDLLVNKSKGNQVAVQNPLRALNSLYAGTLNYFGSQLHRLGSIFIGLWLVVIYFCFNMLKDKANKDTALICLSLIASALAILYILKLYPVRSLSTTYDTGFILLPIMMSMPTAFLISYITKIKYRWLLGCIIILSLLSGLYTYKYYQSFEAPRRLVNSYDINAYKWINENVAKDQKFIGQSVLDSNRSGVVFAIDGSLWLPIFTDNDIGTPFQETRFNSVDSNVNYEYTRLLGSKKQADVKRAVRYFATRNYCYIYVDGENASAVLGIPALLKNNLASIVYKNQEVKIAHLRECSFDSLV